MPYVDSYVWKIRQKIGHDLLLVPSADAVAVNAEGKLLLVFNKDWQGWYFPGGYAEENQSSQECSARELLEEGGLRADPESLTPFAFASGHTARYANGDVVAPFTQFFIANEWAEDTSKLDNSEVDDRKWFSLDELKDLTMNSYTRKIIAAYEAFIQTRQYQMLDVRED